MKLITAKQMATTAIAQKFTMSALCNVGLTRLITVSQIKQL